METLHLQTVIAPDGILRIEAPSQLPPGPAEVVVVINPTQPARPRLKWSDCYGLGEEMWAGQDAQEYVNQLRDEWER